MVERAERRWLWGFALVVVLLTTLPYLIGFLSQSSGWVYTGFVFGVQDGNSYIAKMLNGSKGDWLFRSPYTSYPQRGMLAFFPLMLLGKLVPQGQHAALVGLFQVFRIASIFLYVFAVYDFIALFVCQPRWRRLGVTLVTFGGGLGWLSAFGLKLWGSSLPLDFYSPETFGFLMVYGLPHLACARALLLWALRDYLIQPDPLLAWKWGRPGTSGASIRSILSLKQPGSPLRTALLWLGVGLMQPITVVSGWAVICAHVAATGLWQAWRRQRDQAAGWGEWPGYVRRALAHGILSAPLVLYTLVSFRVDPFLKQWEGQNLITSPGPLHYLLGFGLLLPFSLLGIATLLRNQPPAQVKPFPEQPKLPEQPRLPEQPELSSALWKGWLVVAWAAVFPLLAYAPYNLQRRLPEGIWVALVILALAWIENSGPAARSWAPRWLALSYISALFLILGGALAARQPDQPLFRPVSEVRAFEYLAARAAKDEVVLAAFETGNALPAWANVSTVVGLGPESINGEELNRQVTCFYGGCPSVSDTQLQQLQLKLLHEQKVHYVIWGPEERSLGSWDPRGAPFLQILYQQDDYYILAVHVSS